jgi:hypothetical protein
VVRRSAFLAIVSSLCTAITIPVGAQVIGAFRWQLQPYCNIVTVTVRQDGSVYTVDGSDDLCGGAMRTSVIGTAFLNPDGSIGMGLTSMVVPDVAPIVIYARIDLATVSGVWKDSAGNSGTFQFTPGAGTAGTPRPVPTNGLRAQSVTSGQIAPGAVGPAQLAPGSVGAPHLAPGSVGAAQLALGSITSAHLAAGSVGATQIAAGAVSTSHIAAGAVGLSQLAPGIIPPPMNGTCPVGQYMRGFSPAGAVICEPIWVPTLNTTVDDPANQVGQYTSIAIAPDGLPVVAHRDSTAAALRVTKCGNPSCAAGNVSTTVDDQSNSVGWFASIAIGADGFPVISHQDSTAQALKVTKCGNAACTTGNVTTTVDNPANAVGYDTHIAVPADGLPVISHRDNGVAGLRITKCGNPACSTNISTTVDDVADQVGYETSIAIGVDGLPVVSHRNSTATALRITKCGNAACTAGTVSTNVDDPPGLNVGLSSSIAVGADGLPVISHRDATNGELRVTKCGNAACTAGNVTTAVDAPANAVGSYSSIAVPADGRPVISHQDATATALRITKCGNAACTAGNVSTTVDDPANAVGAFTSIAIGADGLPIVSHRDTAAGTLRVTKCGSQNCR